LLPRAGARLRPPAVEEGLQAGGIGRGDLVGSDPCIIPGAAADYLATRNKRLGSPSPTSLGRSPYQASSCLDRALRHRSDIGRSR
jgi:hypothetical protein